MNDQQEQLPKTNAEWVVYYQSILEELTDQEKSIGSPMTNLEIIIDRLSVPVIVDAGVGTASDASIAMELGCDGVLMNTAIAVAKNPILMASAMKKSIEAGREAFLAGRMPKKLYQASPSSPTKDIIE